jgi:hypothetical protein
MQDNKNISKKIVDVFIDVDASLFLKKNNVQIFSVAVEKIPCGCVRPKEVPVINYGEPSNRSKYSIVEKGEFTIYLAKGMIIPEQRIEIKLGKIGNKKTLYPIGIEYFNGMGQYCELSYSNKKIKK